MDNKEIWKQLEVKHPKFKDPDNHVTLTARGLKALIDQAYDEGHKNGGKWEKRKQDAQKQVDSSGKQGFDAMSMMRDILDGKF